MMTGSTTTKIRGVRISKICRPIKVRTHRLGTLYLRRLTPKAETQIARYKAEGFAGRALLVRILHSHLEGPALSLDVIEQSPDRLLIRVASIWLSALGYSIECNTPSEEAFTVILDNYQLYVDGLNEKLKAVCAQAFENHSLAARAMMADLSAIFRPFNYDPLENVLASFMARPVDIDLGSRFKMPPLPFDTAQIEHLSAVTRISQTLAPVQALADKLSPIRALTDRLAPIQALSERMSPIQALVHKMASVRSLPLAPVWPDMQVYSQVTELTRRLSAIDFSFDLRLPEIKLPSFGLDPAILEGLRRRGEELNAGCLALEESAFAFLAGFISVDAIIQLGRLHQRVQPMILTKTMLAAASTDRFREVMEILFHSDPRLRGRWPAVRSALDNHRRRDYHATIPILLREIEGMFTDYLIAINQATILNGKPHMVEASGAIKLNKNGDPVPFRGLDAKVRHHMSCGFDNDDIEELATKFLDFLAPRRNVISHGNLVDYAQPKLAAQLMWALFVIARTFALLAAEKAAIANKDLLNRRPELERQAQLYLVAL